MPPPCNYKLMMSFSGKRLTWLAALLAVAWVVPALAEIQPYSARYSIYRNGKLTGKVEVSLMQQGGNWTIESEGSGTHGLARILRARDNEKTAGHGCSSTNEKASGQLVEGRFMPSQYSRHTRVAGIDDRWHATFDWASRQVEVLHDNDEAVVLELHNEVLDPLSLKLEMRRRLSEPSPELRFLMVEDDEIDEQNSRHPVAGNQPWLP